MNNNNTQKQECQAPEVLADRSATGRVQPWREHKMQSQQLADIYAAIDARKADRARNCAQNLAFSVQPDGSRRLVGADFCRLRLCPMCQWRRGIKVFGQTTNIIRHLGDGYDYLMLTLTVRNCTPDKLADTLDNITAAYYRLMRRKDTKAILGWMRSIEITHNVAEGTYHPHIHALLAVQSSYWHKYYIRHDQWVDMWQDAAQLDYSPSVRVTRSRGRDPRAIAEIAKYSVKVGDYITPNWELSVSTVALLDDVLRKRRLLAYGGVMRDAKAELQLDDAESDGADLVHTDEQPEGETANTPRIVYSWTVGYNQYVRQ